MVAAQGLDGEAPQALIDAADGLSITAVRLPRINDLSGEATDATATAPIVIEDLLGRPQRALAMTAKGPSAGAIMVPEMSEPARIRDLARRWPISKASHEQATGRPRLREPVASYRPV